MFGNWFGSGCCWLSGSGGFGSVCGCGATTGAGAVAGAGMILGADPELSSGADIGALGAGAGG